MNLPRLLILTDRTQLPEGVTLISQVRGCVQGGATHVVLRELDLAPSERAEIVEELNGVGATVLAAREPLVGAIGVHQASTARGPVRGLVGRSCHAREEVRIAAGDRCSYATLGPFAPSESKPGYGPPLDSTAYADLNLPTFALGGINLNDARKAIDAGAYGVAVMGAAMRSRDPQALVAELLRRLT